MSKEVISLERIAHRILYLRGQKVLLDYHIAELYGIETRALKQVVRRNPDRFPADFMFELSAKEVESLVSQFVIPGVRKVGGAAPMVFTEQGVAMLSSTVGSACASHAVFGASPKTFSRVARSQMGGRQMCPARRATRRAGRPRSPEETAPRYRTRKVR